MRVLLTTQPGFGHLNPTLGLARAARERSWDVLYATSASFAAEVRRAGFDCAEAGIDWMESEVEHLFPDLGERRLSREAELRWWLTDVWGGRFPAAMAPDVARIVSEWRAEVVIHEQWELAGALAAELVGIPYAMHGHGLFMSAASWQELAGPRLDSLRRDAGLPPDPGHEWIHRHLYLEPVPPSFQMPCDLPALHRFRPVFREPQVGTTDVPLFPPHLEGRPRVYASMGTVFRCPRHVFTAILEGLAVEPVNLLLVVGRDGDPAAFGALPAHVRIERWVTQSEVLCSSELVITHAGYNTVAETLSVGLPLLAIPLHANQPSVAKRCDVLGVGRRLRVEEVTPDSIRGAVQTLLGDPRYRLAAERIRDEFRSMPPIDTALDALERLVAGSPRTRG